jgi:hypothetical protein
LAAGLSVGFVAETDGALLDGIGGFIALWVVGVVVCELFAAGVEDLGEQPTTVNTATNMTREMNIFMGTTPNPECFLCSGMSDSRSDCELGGENKKAKNVPRPIWRTRFFVDAADGVV